LNVVESATPHAEPVFPGHAPAPDQSAGAARGFGLGTDGISFDLGTRSRAAGRDDSSATVYIALITGVAVLSLAALIAGISGSPQFSIGLGLGVGAGIVPILIFAGIGAAASSAGRDQARGRRRMTEEEWERVFGSGGGGSRADSASRSGGEQKTSQSADLDDAEPATALQRAYDLLGLSPESGSREVRAAYHRLAQRHHPDKAAGQSDAARAVAEQRMKELNVAYALIRESRGRARA